MKELLFEQLPDNNPTHGETDQLLEDVDNSADKRQSE